MSRPVTARPKLNDFRQSLGYVSADHAHEAALINTKPKGGEGEGGHIQRRWGQNPLAECVPPDRIR